MELYFQACAAIIRKHPLYPAFLSWAKVAGHPSPDTQHPRKWLPWWECFSCGAMAAVCQVSEEVEKNCAKKGKAKAATFSRN